MGRSGEIHEERLPTFGGQPVELGIDEAGRGPVLGPMVYGCALSPVAAREALAARKFDDSKVLKEAERDRMFGEIKGSADIGFITMVLSAELISANMLRRDGSYNLNKMSHDCAIAMIRHAVAQGVNVTEVYVDTVGNEEWYEQKLSREFPTMRCTVRKKADSLFPIVSAASICAKVTRDKMVSNWKFEEPGIPSTEELPLGCGYPSDPLTKAWLLQVQDPVFGFPKLVRFSWSTATELLEQHGRKCDFHNDVDERQISILSFAKPDAHPRKKFFTNRKLSVVSAF